MRRLIVAVGVISLELIAAAPGAFAQEFELRPCAVQSRSFRLVLHSRAGKASMSEGKSATPSPEPISPTA